MKDWQHKGAFVIRFRAGTDLKAGRFEGSAEHVATYQATHFHSLEELLEFLHRVLKDGHANPPTHHE
jgi:hypothetical protein